MHRAVSHKNVSKLLAGKEHSSIKKPVKTAVVRVLIQVDHCFSCERISDDDRMSLTTAVSDDDEGGGGGGGGGASEEHSPHSPHRAKQTGQAAASFNCTGAVRKAGFLSVKKWLLRKKHQIELARKRGWKGYWVCLKGTTLLFYPCDTREGRSVDSAPKHLIIVDGAIMQPIPEHPKRDYIFCLSTAFGDAYLFQEATSRNPDLKIGGLVRDLNPGPPAPEAGIIPLDQRAVITWLIQ
nr:PREDICTED: protein still life, isoforms C/SIF type 2-like [Bemisia tabaci]